MNGWIAVDLDGTLAEARWANTFHIESSNSSYG